MPKKAIPTWVKWLAGGAGGISLLAGGLIIGAIIQKKYSNSIIERGRKRKEIEEAREERERQEKAVKNRKIFLQKVETFNDDNLRKIADFLSKSRNELKDYIVGVIRDNKSFIVNKGGVTLSSRSVCYLDGFKEKIDGFTEVSIGYAKKKEKKGKKASECFDKNSFLIVFTIPHSNIDFKIEYKINILAGAKFELRKDSDGTGVTFECQELQLEKEE